jgi:U3 small nucleolar ribonucleoprotein component
MDTSTIKKQLHSYLEVADDKKIKAFYTMMEDEIKKSGVEYSDELKTELDAGYAAYKNGEAKMVTALESKKRIQKILKPGQTK